MQRPELSARWGVNAKKRIIGLLRFAGYATWLYFATSSAINAMAIAIAFGFIIMMSFASDRPLQMPALPPDCVVQLEFPFPPTGDAATRQLAGRR